MGIAGSGAETNGIFDLATWQGQLSRVYLWAVHQILIDARSGGIRWSFLRPVR